MRNFIKDSKVHYIWIKTKTDDYNKLIFKLQSRNINIYNIKYDKGFILLKIKNYDFDKIKKYLISYKFIKVKDSGIFNLKNIVLKNNRFFLAIIFGAFLIYLFSNIIVDVNVIHSNKDIRNLVEKELDKRGIKRLTLKKDYQELQKIKEEILNSHKKTLEWIEIEPDGMTYNVRIEERIITNTTKKEEYCHIIAEKSGIISKIVTQKGVSIVNLNKYVSKGDILISGEVKHNEEVKDNVCAMGKVYAEVWYKVNISLPLNYEEKKLTGKMRYNLMYQDDYGEHIILNSRLKNKETKNIEVFSFLGRKLFLQKEYETIVKKKIYTKEEALKEALKLGQEKINVKLEENEKISSQKVLKKSIINSKMEVEIFTAVIEDIGVLENYTVEQKEENNNDLEYSR